MYDYYDLLSKRRSVRKYDAASPLTKTELDEIMAALTFFTPLLPDIRVEYELVKRTDTNAKFGEYGIRIYSEKKPNYLINAGYLLEQLDLFLAARGIGACWYGLAGRPKPSACPEGTAYVILMVFGKSDGELFRSEVSQFTRKKQSETWFGETISGVTEAALIAPSACNSQPWRIENKGGILKVCRDPKPSIKLPRTHAAYFNSIDMGIFLYFLETALKHTSCNFERTVFEPSDDTSKYIPIAEYKL